MLNAGFCNECTATGCLACNFNSLSLCKLCVSGMYLVTATNLCSNCSSPCLTCQTDTVCTTCLDGYFMQAVNNLPTGKCLACSSNCATCVNTPTSCVTCPTGSNLVGLKCLSTQNVGFNLTFSSPSATSLASELQSFMVVIEEIRASVAGNLGTPFNTNPGLLSFSSITSGSVKISGNADTSQSSPSTTYTAMGSIQPSGGYVGFSLISSSYVANGFNPSNSASNVNLPLVLGITIPVVILFVVVGVVIFVKLRHKGNSIK